MKLEPKTCVLILICVLTFIQIANTFTFESTKNTIHGEYIVLCTHAHSHEAKTNFFYSLKQKFGISIKPAFDIAYGKYRAYLLCNLTEQHVEHIRTQEGLQIIEANRHVKAVAINYKDFVHNTARPDNISKDATFCYEQDTGRSLWGLSRINQRDKLGRSGEYRWSFDDDGTGVDVYVIDSGCNIDHEEFGGRARRGFTATQLLRAEGADDLHGHGTHVSGTIAGTSYGVAKAANIIAVKALDRNGVGTIADIVEGLAYIYGDFVNNKKTRGVINLSLGSFGRSSALENTIDLCIDAGINVVVASGNDFDDACSYTPAHVRRAITVSSSNINDVMSSFSNFGACVDLFAPGESIISAYVGGSDAYAVSDGTSMASPHVAGAIARYLSHSDTTIPSPRDVALYFDFMATTDAIDLSMLPNTDVALETKNKLLYVECSRATRIFSSGARACGFTYAFYMFLVMVVFSGKQFAV